MFHCLLKALCIITEHMCKFLFDRIKKRIQATSFIVKIAVIVGGVSLGLRVEETKRL